MSDTLSDEVKNLAVAFDKTVEQIAANVAVLAEQATRASETAVSLTENGVIADARKEIRALQEILEDIEALEDQESQLNSLYDITQHMRKVTLGLENKLK